MIQWVLLVTAACVTGVKLDQPNQCQEDSQCSTGYFCDTQGFFCQECLRCEDLKRESPKDSMQCIKSVSQCGLCLKGLVPDRLDIGLGCVEPESGEGLPSVYVVALVLVGLLLFILVFAALVYVLRHKDTFKILASTRTSVQAPVGGVAPSAPQPPPYNFAANYEPVRPASPPAPFTPQPPYTEDSTLPLVKRAGSERGGGAARESAGSQNARVFGNPAYVRNVPPPSYDTAFSDESDHEGPFVPHDEDTMESVWTPNTNGTNEGNQNGGVATTVSSEQETGAVALRRPDRLNLSPPPNKMRCLEDNNNNSSGEGSSSARPPSPPPAPAPPAPAPPVAPSVVINVLNVNSVRQLNDITL